MSRKLIIIMSIILILAVLMIISGGVLLGLGELLKPFNALYVGIPMIVVGATSFIIIGITMLIELT